MLPTEIAEKSMHDEQWRDIALCAEVDPELWFPERGEPSTAAKLVCGWCPVRAECLAFALERNEQFGVWGGLSAMERRRLRRALRLPVGVDEDLDVEVDPEREVA